MKVLLPLISLAYLAFAQDICIEIPVECGPEDMPCYGGSDSNGCPYGDFCWPAKGNVHRFINVLQNDSFRYFYQVNWIILAKTVQLHVPPNVMGMTCGVLEDTMN